AAAAEAPEARPVDLSEEFRATLTKVADGKVTFVKSAANRGDEQTLPVADNVQVFRGRLGRDTKEVEAGDPIDRGLRNEMFARIPDRGIRVSMLTDTENKKVAEIYVLPAAGRRGQ